MVWLLSDLEGWLFPGEASPTICNHRCDLGYAKLKWLQLLRDLLYLKPEPALKLVDVEIVRIMLELILKHPLSNILHNIIRDILVYSIR
jgi:hypothetical protein